MNITALIFATLLVSTLGFPKVSVRLSIFFVHYRYYQAMRITFYLFLPDYASMYLKWCSSDKMGPDVKDILTLSEAKEKCTSNKGCGMFIDLASKHEKYSLCTFNSEIFSSSVSSTLYLKCKINSYH